VGKITSSRKAKTLKPSQQPPTPPGGDAVEGVLVPSGFSWTRLEQSDFRLIATQGPETRVADAESAAAPRGSGVGLPVFTLVPRHSYEGELPADDVPSSVEHRTRPYGGHDLILSGSMSDRFHGPPSFTLTPAAGKIQGPSKPSIETKRKE
jgi:hypothetical protein